MANTVNVFDFEIDAHGAAVTVVRDRLTSAALTDGEVDWQVQALKEDLDRVADEMKAAIREQSQRDPFEGN